jgi:hypothetical protein
MCLGFSSIYAESVSEGYGPAIYILTNTLDETAGAHHIKALRANALNSIFHS